MTKASITALLLVQLLLGTATAQEGMDQRVLKPWMTGIIAVGVFLFLVFMVFLVKKAWCEDSREEEPARGNEYTMTNDSRHSTNLDVVRSVECENAYENIATEGNGVVITAM